MNCLQSVFVRKKLVIDRLVPFGFLSTGQGYVYTRRLRDSGFEIVVTVNVDGKISADVIDPELHEPYTLHLADGAVGGFVGAVRSEYEKLLTEISDKCFLPDVFKSPQAKELISYVCDTYADELEFLWEKFPDNAVWRRRDNKKWYAALLTVSKRKLGIKSDETVEIIDLRVAPEDTRALIDNKLYYPGWHMNKKSWYTVILDGSVPLEELRRRLDESYLLAMK